MGIRVDEESLKRQLEASGHTERAELPFHRDLLNGNMPLTIGGGLGQSRICMLILKKCHLGEVQSSYWPEEVMEEAAGRGIALL